MSRLCSIHQPNFFPWLGYFDKIRRADVFVFLDAVDYPRAGSGSMGSWVNRVRLNFNGEPRWATCPVKRMPLGSPIHEAQIDDTQRWRRSLLRSLEANYRRAPNYPAGITVLGPLIEAPETNLARFNMAAVRAIATVLGIDAEFHLQSELRCEGAGTDLLVSIVEAVGCDGYLAGGGAAGYQEDERFAERGIELRYQSFTPTVYGPPERYLPGLSVIDYVMNAGEPLSRMSWAQRD